jgi:hypothetical protein
MAMKELNCLKRCSPSQLEKQFRAEQRNQSKENARRKKSRTVKSEVYVL